MRVLLVVLCVAGCSTAKPAPEPLRDADPPGHTVEVRPGDTLSALARRYRTTVADIADVNGLDVDDPIRPGQVLFLPDPGPVVVEPAPPAAPVAAAPPIAATGLVWPLDEGVVLREFDAGAKVPHEGILFAAPRGTPVRAAADGEVLFAGDEGTAFGRLVVVRHADDLVTVYAHLDDVRATAGARVRRGDVIGHVGATGKVEAPRLHFQVRRGRTPVDPATVLPPP